VLYSGCDWDTIPSRGLVTEISMYHQVEVQGHMTKCSAPESTKGGRVNVDVQ